MTNRVQEAINGPNENTQRAVEQAISQLSSALQDADTNDLSPGLRSDLSELRVGDVPVAQLVGVGLLKRLNEVFENGYTSVQTLDQLRNIQKNVESLDAGLQSLTSGLSALGLISESSPEGESVVGMTVPRAEVTDGLRELLKELVFFDRLILNLAECVDGKATDPKIVSLRSSDFGIDVSTTLDVAGVFALIVKGLKLALSKVRKYRRLKEDAEELGVAETVDAIDRKSTEAMAAAINDIEAEVFQHCQLDDAGRVNELRTAIKFKINGLTNRMERGFSFEVRTALPPKPDQRTAQLGETIASLSQISFEPNAGARLLPLPEDDVAPQEDNAQPAGKMRKPSRKRS